MDKDGKFWLGVWIVGAVAMLLVSAAGFAYYTRQQALIAEMVKGGADPIRAMCAVTGDQRPACTAIALQSKP